MPRSQNSLDSKAVLTYVQKNKHFSTNQIAKHFHVRPMQAAAGIAILRIKEVVEPAPKPPEKDKDQSSRWVYTG